MILDKTYYVKEYSENESNICYRKQQSLGAIGNVISALSTIDKNCKLDVSTAIGDDENAKYIRRWFTTFRKLNPDVLCDLDIEQSQCPTSEAVIISDVSRKKRSSVVSWGACANRSTIKVSDVEWLHIMYADKLPNLNINDLKSVSKNTIISIDLCSSNYEQGVRDRIEKMLPHVDFVLGSFEEGMCLANDLDVNSSIKKIASMCRAGVLLHSPEGSRFIDKVDDKIKIHKNLDMLQGPLNVLGAGDIFASSFIISMLKNRNMEESVKFSHKHTTSTLRKRQKNGKI